MSSSIGISSGLPVDAGFSTFLMQLCIKEEYAHLKDVYFKLIYEGSEYTFSAHQMVLAMRSPYFSDQFYGKEKVENALTFKDINPRDFKQLINYCYDYEPPIETPKEACDIYRVAEEFQVFSLMKLCSDRIENMKIIPSNLFDMLKASENLQNIKMKNKCLEYFQKNTSKVLNLYESYDLSEISPLTIDFLLTANELSLNCILDLFEWIYLWAKSRFLNDSTFGTVREAVGEFLPQLPFASLSVEQFAELYRNHPEVLYDNEVIGFFMKYSLSDGSWDSPVWYNAERKMKINPIPDE